MFCVANKKVLRTFLNDERPKRKRRASRRGNPESRSNARIDCHVALRAPRNDGLRFMRSLQRVTLPRKRNDFALINRKAEAAMF
jgi:hypothetical protein